MLYEIEVTRKNTLRIDADFKETAIAAACLSVQVMKADETNAEILRIVPSYKVGDHFTGNGGELVITGLTQENVFYCEAGDPSLEGSIINRKAFNDCIFSGAIHSHREETAQEKAMRYIDNFCVRTFQRHAEFDNPEHILIGYTTLVRDKLLPVEVYADLVHFEFKRYILNVCVENRRYDSLENLIHFALEGLDFSDLAWCTDEQIAYARKHEHDDPGVVKMSMDTSDLEVPNFPGTWRVIDHADVGDNTYWLMVNNTNPSLFPIVVDSKGQPCLKHTACGFDANNLRLLALEALPVPRMPDPSISIQEMKAYGYFWGGMLPMRKEAATIVAKQCPVYCLYEDNSEGLITKTDEFEHHAACGGIFGVEKEAWLSCMSNNSA